MVSFCVNVLTFDMGDKEKSFSFALYLTGVSGLSVANGILFTPGLHLVIADSIYPARRKVCGVFYWHIVLRSASASR
jgi:hypothetical protein